MLVCCYSQMFKNMTFCAYLYSLSKNVHFFCMFAICFRDIFTNKKLILFIAFCRLAVYLKVLMSECVDFSHTAGSPYYDGCMMLQLGCC